MINNWIDAFDELPDCDRKIGPMMFSLDVLALDTNKDQCVAYYRKYFKGSGEGWLGTNGLEITHWMPLPEPPK